MKICASYLWSWSTDILKQNTWYGYTHFFDGIGLITNEILMIDEWEAHYILTWSISYDIFGILIMAMVYWYFKLL
jgi:hypothetical protein